MGFLDQLLEAINQEQQARAFGPDWQMKERQARLAERSAEMDAAFRRAQISRATRDWDAKLRAAQQLHPDLAPEEALAKVESEDIGLERESKRAEMDYRRAAATRALREPTPRARQKVWTGQGFQFLDPEELEGRTFPQEPSRGTSINLGGFAANPFNVTDAEGNTRLAVRVKGGGLQFVDEIGGTQVGPGPTAEQRNQERYDVMLPTQIAAVRQALDNVKAATGGSWTGSLDALRPGSPAFMATQNYSRLIEGIAATAARAMGDTRISDLDSRRYARLFGVANQLAATPPGSDLAESLLTQAEDLMKGMSAARRESRLPAGVRGSEPDFSDVEGEGSTGAREDINYEDLP